MQTIVVERDVLMNVTHQLKNGDLLALSVFLAVAAHKSFRAAAIELGVSPSAVSHSIKALERRLGVRLLNRTTRSVSLTDAGERLALKLRPAMSDISEAMREVDLFRATPSGTIRLNASEGAVRWVLLPILARFLQQYPLVHLDIVCDGKLNDIVAEGFDAGIRLGEAVPQDMVAVRLTDPMRFAAVASPDYFNVRGRPSLPSDLVHHDCIRFRFESGALYRWEFESEGSVEQIQVHGRLTLSDQLLMVEAAIEGLGIAFVPEHLVSKALASGCPERVLEPHCPIFPGLHMYYPGRRHVPSGLRALVAMIRLDRQKSASNA